MKISTKSNAKNKDTVIFAGKLSWGVSKTVVQHFADWMAEHADINSTYKVTGTKKVLIIEKVKNRKIKK